jgi:hypothetical protein
MSGQALYRPRRPALSRTLAEAAAMPVRSRPEPGVASLAARMPHGDGAVLVMPASLRGDSQTDGIRRFLGELGYTPFGWELGVNLGPVPRVVAGSPRWRRGMVRCMSSASAWAACSPAGWRCARRHRCAAS